ncbi:energy transducer TonB family protein [Janthinobacterium fluminis]|uniref:Energy transducer TonB n=1 Tax=Janthinobacterium fluminis TaxID=2987524 RepID=A0ABT5K4P4_9BURK|nr:energy transducer TonB [Janthinobacterium fluminis]MDC8759660.1 energy transducer TonB [Janthinobacterium fluminis]
MPCYAARLSRLGAVLALLCGLAAPASAADGAAGPPPAAADAPGRLFDFDIAAQPLAAALNRYASLTERAALFRSEVVAGRTSSAVVGRFTPEAALSLLLAGTGLLAERASSGPADVFVLKAQAAPASAMQTALASAGAYPGLVQARIWDALCAHAGTAPGAYRALLRFYVDGGGAVQRPRLLRSTGDARRDAAMLDALRRVRMAAPPPADMPQPLTVIVLPDERRVAGAGPHCRSGGVS